MKFYSIILILLISLFCQKTFGQEYSNSPNNLKFKHFSTKDGLSQSSVITILQDKKGYLWFGTRDGLNKYDGNKFITYRHNSEDPKSLSHSWITIIFEDSYGNLWVGTKDGLNKYNTKEDNFKKFKKKDNSSTNSNNEIWDLTQIDDENLLVATNNGVNQINISNNSFKASRFGINNSSLKDRRIRSFQKTSDGKLYISTIENISLYNSKENSFKQIEYPQNINKELHINNAPTFFIDKKQQLWLGHAQGLATFNELEMKFENYKLDNITPITSAVRTICEDVNGTLWVGTYTGLYILDHQKGKLNKFVHNETDPKSLSQNSIYKILQDSRGDIWIGTWAGGINFFDKSFDNFKQLSAGATNNMLNYKVISSIIENDNNELWIGTEGGGINIYNRNSGLFTYHTNDIANKSSLSSNNVKSMIKDRNGNFWIGTHDGGLNFLNPLKKPFKFEHFDAYNENDFKIKDYRILALFEDVNGNIWIGSLTGGLIFFDTSNKRFIKLENKLKSITSIVQSNDSNKILVGGTKGFEQVNINSREISQIIFKDNQNESSTDRSVNCIFEDDNQNYWVGTEGQGLYFYNPKNGEKVKYGIAQGFLNEVIYGILPDDNNHLWISTNNGLSRLNLSTNKISNFDESDGLQSSEFNYGAFVKTGKGELMFGGTNGLNYFNPDDIIENTFIPSVDIYDVKVSNKPFLKVTDSVSEVKLKYDQNDFSIDFTALSYSQPNKNQYAYKLVGFDPEWNYIANKKTATYTNLDEGKYTFRVKASNNNGLWNEKGDSLKIIILPAPWKTWWAYLLYLLLLLLVLYFARKFVITRIQEKNELKKEKLEKEKLEEVNQLKLKLFTNISHDFRTPLTLIVGPVEQLLKLKNNNTLIKRNLETIQRNTNILLQLINELLDFRKNESGKLELHASKNNIIPFIENIKLSFEELALQRNITYNFTYTKENIEVWFDKIKMKKVLFNLLSNAFKFTSKDNKISLHISTVLNDREDLSMDEFLKIDITNYGKVIPSEHIEFIFDRFYQLDQKDVETGTGIGLSLTKSLVELHKGKVTVSSSEKDGTCFSVLLPLGKSHLLEKECVNEIEKITDNEIFNKPVFVQKEIRSQEIEAENKVIEFDENKSTLLIVEDNTEVRNFIKNIFISKYNIFEAGNGKDGIEIAKDKPIDLIISDIMMPIMDGFELCKNIKTNIMTSHIPIILLTAKTSDIHRKEGYNTGANAYIVKPFDANILEVRVDNLLKSRQSLISKFKKDIILKPKELTITSADELFLEKAIKVVEDNISDSEFNVYAFTSQMHMSRSVLFRKIKALTGQSISSFIRTIKLKRAGQLLIQTKMNISEIAYEVGFNDLKYFRKCFKNLFNEIPSDYRTKKTPDSSGI